MFLVLSLHIFIMLLKYTWEIENSRLITWCCPSEKFFCNQTRWANIYWHKKYHETMSSCESRTPPSRLGVTGCVYFSSYLHDICDTADCRDILSHSDWRHSKLSSLHPGLRTNGLIVETPSDTINCSDYLPCLVTLKYSRMELLSSPVSGFSFI